MWKPKNSSFNCTLWNWNPWYCSLPFVLLILLIVPYGIETPLQLRRAFSPPFSFNCTLWNWNLRGWEQTTAEEVLLIVPYGIETKETPYYLLVAATFNCTLWNWNSGQAYYTGQQGQLLIVPYGIETWISSAVVFVCVLLIVPYGIETLRMLSNWSLTLLLIVPYGIETSFCWTQSTNHLSFNCTLWNWNCLLIFNESEYLALLIVPYGIETYQKLWWNTQPILLIVPYGIETLHTSLPSASSSTFNCTLWNWNAQPTPQQEPQEELLIVPYGIETSQGYIETR